MKYLFWLLVILVALWAIKRSRPTGHKAPSQRPPESTPAEMAICLHCGLHLPREEAVAGQKGVYCSTDHRAAAQDHPPV